MSVSIAEFLQLRHEFPVVDVRSPREYKSGHIPGAVNVPLLNDDERVAVGTAYVQQGQLQAIHEGFRRVGPRLNELIAEAERVSNGRELLVHCWRGGMRSGNFCQFMSMAKITSRALIGGYKAYRQMALESFKGPFQLILLGGCTGGGKSEALHALAAHGEQVLDLEQLASHKGSAFGGLMMPPQPTTEQFQNELFEAIISLDRSKPIWVEDESLAIGKLFMPEDFWRNMGRSPLVQMDVPRDVRVKRLVAEYGGADRQLFLEIMGKIMKRLGGQHYKAAVEKLRLGDMAAVIDILLTYYDKAYLESISKRKDRLMATLTWDGNDIDDFAGKLRTMKMNTLPS